eukprot:scaffold1132_cov377-Prasinococcus_capsulatus_cf.AAC.6
MKSRLEIERGQDYPGKGSPSSGFVALFFLLQICDHVDVYGVGDGFAGAWHYFEERDFADSREFGKDPHHSFDLEGDVIRVMDAALGVLTHHRSRGDGLSSTQRLPPGVDIGDPEPLTSKGTAGPGSKHDRVVQPSRRGMSLRGRGRASVAP